MFFVLHLMEDLENSIIYYGHVEMSMRRNVGVSIEATAGRRHAPHDEWVSLQLTL